MKKYFTVILSVFLLLGFISNNDTVSAATSDAVNCQAARTQYWNDNPDVKAANFEAFLHYTLHGKSEGRLWKSELCDTTATAVTPKITAIAPIYGGAIGSTVTLTGEGFTPTGNKIKFGNTGTEINPQHNNVTSKDGVITFEVPSGVYYACMNEIPKCAVRQVINPDGEYKVSMINGVGKESNTVIFNIRTATAVNAPKIISIEPSTGIVGSTVTIKGSGFTNLQYFASGGLNNKIKFGNLGSENNPEYNIVPDANGNLVFKVPTGNYYPCWDTRPTCAVPSVLTAPGNYDISVINGNGESNKVSFVVVANSTPVTCIQPSITKIVSPNGGESYVANSQFPLTFKLGCKIPDDAWISVTTGHKSATTGLVDRFAGSFGCLKPYCAENQTWTISDSRSEYPEKNFTDEGFDYSKSYKMRIRVYSNAEKKTVIAEDYSDDFFSITKPNDIKQNILITINKNPQPGGSISVNVGEKFVIKIIGDTAWALSEYDKKQYFFAYNGAEFSCSTEHGDVLTNNCVATKKGLLKFSMEYYIRAENIWKTTNVIEVKVNGDETISDEDCKETIFTTTLKLGSRGDEVDELQAVLVDARLLAERYANGYFGTKTRTALKKLQKQNRISQSGQTDEKTRALLNEMWYKNCSEDSQNEGLVLGAKIKKATQKIIKR